MESIPACWICVALCILVSVTLSEANQYFVGGSKDIGWNDKPKKESYNHWSKKTRFAVNDTIVFTYPLGKDTVLYVREEDYKKCENKNPVKTWDEGYTEVTLFRTGTYHFIGGNDGSCQKGQRLIVFVPEVQPLPPDLTPAAAPSPLSPPVPLTPPPTQTAPSLAPSISHPPAAAPSPLSPPVPSTPPPTQKAPSSAPSISHPPESSPPSATISLAPLATAPQPSVYAPAPAPSSALPIATQSMLSPLVGLVFLLVLFY